MDELKPCPFCGRPAHLRQGHFWYADCACAFSGCVSMGPFFTKAEAIDAWNTRAERTCRIDEYDEAPFSICSECGTVQPDDFTVYYCWNCGAKVVG